MSSFAGMNYRDLQKLAKTAGVKANLPKADLIKALEENAANDSVEIESSPSNKSPLVSLEAGLNSTFEIEANPKTDDNKLNTTFERETESPEANGGGKRKSSRLSVDNLSKLSLQTETQNSPKPRKSAAGGVNTLVVPERMPTPRLGSARKATPRRSSTTASTTSKKSSVNSGRKSTPRVLSGGASNTPKVTSGSAKKTPRTQSGKIVKPVVRRTPKTLQKSTPGTSSKPSLARSSAKKTNAASAIPRFVKFAKKVPNFAKMHAEQFSKMESLDAYLDKKKKRNETTQEHIKKARALAEEHTKIVERVKARTPAVTKFVPDVISTSKMNLNFGGTDTPASGRKQAFKFSAAPAVASAKKPARAHQADVKAMTRDKPKAKPPVAAAPPARTPRTHATPTAKPLNNITNKSVAETPGSTKKQFNLKASLAKPLGYKPHTGKLPTWGDKKIIEPRAVSAKEMIDRTRNIIKGVRMNKRAALLLQNRNIKE